MKLGRLGVLAAVVAGCALLYVNDWDVLGSQFSAYRVGCDGVVVGNECSQATIALNATTYRVLVDQKAVEKVSPPAEYTKYTNCAITSRTDWKCSFAGEGSGQFGATNGVFFMNTGSQDWVERFIYVSRWKYLAIKSGLWPLFSKTS